MKTKVIRLESKQSKAFKENMILFGLALPGLVFLILCSYLPMGGIAIAFKDFSPRKGIWGSPWNGFDNFKFFFTSQDAVRTLRNTVLYNVGFLVLDLIFGVGFALMLYYLKNQVALKVYHTIMLMPRFISIIVVSFMVYGFLSPTYGLINQMITFFGGDRIEWYSNPDYWPWILPIVRMWKMAGAGCLYYYAALVGIDGTLFEAAELDGANTLQKCWHICIPNLIPTMIMLTILGIGNLFNGDLGLFLQVPRDSGILYETTDIINTYVYRALMDGSLEKSAAVGLFQSVVGLVLVLTVNGIVRKVSPENSMF